MPIPFGLIPDILKLLIVEKQDILDFVEFHESSQDCYDIAEKVKTKFVIEKDLVIDDDEIYLTSSNFNLLNVTDLPVRFVALKTVVLGFLYEHNCGLLLDFFSTTDSTTNSLEVYKDLKCKPDQFNRLIEVAELKKLECKDIEQQYFAVSNISMLTDLTTIIDFQLETSVLLSVKIPNITIDGGVNSTAINQLLTEWLYGQREIVTLDFSSPQKAYDYEEMFREIPHIRLNNDDENMKRCTISRPSGDTVYVAYDEDHVRIWS